MKRSGAGFYWLPQVDLLEDGAHHLSFSLSVYAFDVAHLCHRLVSQHYGNSLFGWELHHQVVGGRYGLQLIESWAADDDIVRRGLVHNQE